VKKIGFLSFGHWTPSPHSQVRTGADALLQSIELAVAAEELGADGAYFRVHHFARQLGSPFPLLAAVGARTSKIEIGTAVIDMRYENPLYMAEDAGAADLIAGGRLQLGISRGSPEQVIEGWRYFGYAPQEGQTDADMARRHAEVFLQMLEGKGFAQPDFYEELFSTCVRLMTRLHEIPQPVIARVHGVATAAGCQLVAACDLAIAAADARFATPGVNIGLFCSTPMVPVARSIGRKRALEMLFTDEMIDAATALDWGLVNRVVEPEHLDTAVDELAARFAAASGYVVALGKRAFYGQDQLPEPAAYDIACPVMVDNAHAADAHEGMTAFLEKRAPKWKNQ
jgi:enoyl-CoA hydratase/carnithine racemase